MRKLIVTNLETEDIIYLKNRGRKFDEFVGAFNTTKVTAKIDANLPYAYKSVNGEDVLMGVAEYFNTKVPGSVYAQVRTSKVVDGIDKNTFTYPNDDELNMLIKMFTLDKITDEQTFKDKQVLEAVKIEEVVK